MHISCSEDGLNTPALDNLFEFVIWVVKQWLVPIHFIYFTGLVVVGIASMSIP